MSNNTEAENTMPNIGDSWNGQDTLSNTSYTIIRIGVGEYHVNTNGIYYTITTDIAGAMIAGGGLSSAGIHMTPPPMTTEETNELEMLEQDLTNWKKQQKLVFFKELPVHIRQDIADEAYLKEVAIKFDTIQDASFDNISRMNVLKSKKDNRGPPTTHFTIANIGHWDTSDGFKYKSFLDLFTKNEILTAHAEATLEEELDKAG